MTLKPRLVLWPAVALVIGVVGLRWLDSRRVGAPSPATTTAPADKQSAATVDPRPPVTAFSRPAASALVVRDVVVLGLDGRVAWRGDVDLTPVLARIEAGGRDPHRNDGGIFGNRERSLPEQRRGYYHEYVIRTPGLSGPGPQRLVLGAGGEVYYSSDHYTTFRPVR